MKRAVLATLLLGTSAAVAHAQTAATSAVNTNPPASLSIAAPVAAVDTGQGLVLVYDKSLSEKFEIKREIVDQVQAIWGEAAAYESGEQIPEPINNKIVAGLPMPNAAPIEPVPAALDDLPKLLDDSRWVKSGTHLVELTPDNTIAMVVYNVLP